MSAEKTAQTWKNTQDASDNYELSRNRAEKYFLQFDQEQIIRTHQLQADENWIYTDFLQERYRISRKTGRLEKSRDGFVIAEEAGHAETLTIFDFLCHNMTSHGAAEAEAANRVSCTLSGKWAPVNSLKGRPKTVGVGTGLFTNQSAVFDADREGFAAACESLGGEKVPYGDIGYRIPVWGEVSMIIKFFVSDDEFPAQLTVLFDENLLSFIFYETVFYLTMLVLDRIQKEMKQRFFHA